MSKKTVISLPLILTVALVAAQCVAPTVQEAAPASGRSDEPKIVVMKPWSRPSPVMAGNGAVYMTLVNEGGSPDVLVGAETDAAEVVELHESKMEGDVMKMSRVSDIPVPAEGSAKLEPGGLHLMLIDLKRELTPGDTITLTLQFEISGPVTVEAEVR